MSGVGEPEVRAIVRQWAWKIREDGQSLPPDMLQFALEELIVALTELTAPSPSRGKDSR